jgi:hypothetical protein
MIDWLFRNYVPNFDHGDLSFSEIWYLMGDPELVQKSADQYEIHFVMAEKKSPKYEDRSYDKKYKLQKHRKTKFSLAEATALASWMGQMHSFAHD